MKKSILLSIAASLSLHAFADLEGAGYYRVHNYKTDRYVSVVDDKGRIDYMNATADLQAIQLQKNFDEVCCDPASVLYIIPQGSQYQIEAQGTGIYQIISHYVGLKDIGAANNGQRLYNAYGELSGIVKYLGDGQFLSFMDIGGMVTHAKGDYVKWHITPISPKTDNFFGIKPTVYAEGKYYTTMIASFPFSTYSAGMKVYYIPEYSYGRAVLKEIDGTVPAGTPVIIECFSDSPITNKVDVGGEADAITDNSLKGSYFCCQKGGSHNNYVVYNPDTMRVLGVCEDGSLGFVKDRSLLYIPKNECYITVPEGSPDEYRFVSQEEYDAGVEDLMIDHYSVHDVYNVHGQLILKGATVEEINNLPAGIYIAGGKKYMVR